MLSYHFIANFFFFKISVPVSDYCTLKVCDACKMNIQKAAILRSELIRVDRMRKVYLKEISKMELNNSKTESIEDEPTSVKMARMSEHFNCTDPFRLDYCGPTLGKFFKQNRI